MLSMLSLLRLGRKCLCTYVQGQSPRPGTREYFYYVDHQGQLFMDDVKLKNFVTCFKDKKFLAFFFKRLRVNSSGHYMSQFPYVSLCGHETNYVRCDDVPMVFTHLLSANGQVVQDIAQYCAQASDQQELVSYGGSGHLLTIPFQPSRLLMFPASGRVYHPGPEHTGKVGLVKSSLAIELSQYFRYSAGSGDSAQPVGFSWKGHTYKLDNAQLMDALNQLHKRG